MEKYGKIKIKLPAKVIAQELGHISEEDATPAKVRSQGKPSTAKRPQQSHL